MVANFYRSCGTERGDGKCIPNFCWESWSEEANLEAMAGE